MNEHTISNNKILVAMFLDISTELVDHIQGDTVAEMVNNGYEFKRFMTGGIQPKRSYRPGRVPSQFNEDCRKAFRQRFLELAGVERDFIPDAEVRELAALRVGLPARLAPWVRGDTVADMMSDADSLFSDYCSARGAPKPGWYRDLLRNTESNEGPYSPMSPACKDFAERFEQASRQGLGWTDANGEHWTRLY